MNCPQDHHSLLEESDRLRERLGGSIHDRVTASIFDATGDITRRAVTHDGRRRWQWDRWLDRLLISRAVGIPMMILMLGMVFWLTIKGANVPSAFLAGALIEPGGLAEWTTTYLGLALPAWLSFSVYDLLHGIFAWAHAPAWLSGFLIDGVYLALAWVTAVMLPPMAIFFPLFTFMEDLGVLPRLAFNMDRFFRAVGAHGKQALTMSMGFGCNAAGVIACRIIDSPRERLIAILTNNFVPCNGRWPTMIMVASLFVAAGFTGWMASVAAVGTLVLVTMLGVGVTLLVALALSRTLLKGTASSFVLEMPPYRPPKLGRILYTSLIDRTLFVLRRAVICAAPAGGLIWLLGAIQVGQTDLFTWLAAYLNPLGHLMGLDGVIVIAFLFAIPANEIIVPTIIMGYMHTTRMVELANPATLFHDNGWTMLTAVCLLLFSLMHWPCTTTTLTIWSETRSWKWTLLANAIPTALGVTVCIGVAATARALGWA